MPIIFISFYIDVSWQRDLSLDDYFRLPGSVGNLVGRFFEIL